MNKILISTLLLIILIFSIGLVSANENINDTIIEDNTDAPNLSYLSNIDNVPLKKTGGVVRYVNGSTFEDIQKTINIANDNDTIVLNGTYKSTGHQIIVNKSITITSENGHSTLDANKKYRALYILSDNVVLKNLRIINGKVNGGYLSILEPLESGPGGAIYWKGNNGTIIASSIYNNEFYSVSYGGSGAIYWEGANGTIRDTFFFNNTGYHGIMGAASHYKFLEGVVHGDYIGDLYDNDPSKPARFYCVVVNSKGHLTANNLSINYGTAGNFLVKFSLGDIPFKGDIVKVHIFKKGYDKIFNLTIDDKGLGVLKLPDNLNDGIYKVELSSHDKLYKYSANAIIKVNKVPAFIHADNFKTIYNSGKYFTVELMDIKNYYFISNVKLALKVNGKTYYATTNKNGKAKFNVSKWKAGNYKAYINILNNYKSPTQKVNIKINKIPTIVKTNKITAKIHKDKKLNIKIINKKTKKAVPFIKIKVKCFTGKKYKTYTLITDEKGQTHLHTCCLKVGTHKVVIKSANQNYAINKNTKIKIKK
ncbi:hypothetical protein MBORA_10180 [Methanobrevibacter oralis]|uniref:Adhesin-like protein n=1 Tax=Methanobrevibacter oralis TaxID=66851 RepID=A0A166CBJ9_METOA|nr:MULTISPECIES: hypothetical protein [Methanobrevibacter]KZX12907.1 hypothetical protein MBORA_10180 [Methanobrevibacter oralis]